MHTVYCKIRMREKQCRWNKPLYVYRYSRCEWTEQCNAMQCNCIVYFCEREIDFQEWMYIYNAFVVIIVAVVVVAFPLNQYILNLFSLLRCHHHSKERKKIEYNIITEVF